MAAAAAALAIARLPRQRTSMRTAAATRYLVGGRVGLGVRVRVRVRVGLRLGLGLRSGLGVGSGSVWPGVTGAVHRLAPWAGGEPPG